MTSLVAKSLLPCGGGRIQGQGQASSSSSCSCCCMSRSAIAGRNPIGISSRRAAPKSVSGNRRIGLTICEVALKVEGAQGSKAEAVVGSRIRVKGPLKVHHVPKNPEFELGGHEGEVKEVLTSWKGKVISANLPFKVQFFIPAADDGKQIKFVAHLREDEFEVIS